MTTRQLVNEIKNKSATVGGTLNFYDSDVDSRAENAQKEYLMLACKYLDYKNIKWTHWLYLQLDGIY